MASLASLTCRSAGHARPRRRNFCQYTSKFADVADVPTYKFRGDEERAFVEANLNTKSFPTVNFISADGKVTKYESEVRTVEAFKEFVSSQK